MLVLTILDRKVCFCRNLCMYAEVRVMLKSSCFLVHGRVAETTAVSLEWHQNGMKGITLFTSCFGHAALRKRDTCQHTDRLSSQYETRSGKLVNERSCFSHPVEINTHQTDPPKSNMSKALVLSLSSLPATYCRSLVPVALEPGASPHFCRGQ